MVRYLFYTIGDLTYQSPLVATKLRPMSKTFPVPLKEKEAHSLCKVGSTIPTEYSFHPCRRRILLQDNNPETSIFFYATVTFYYNKSQF